MSSDLLSLTSPVLYAGSALVVTVVALVAIALTLMRQRRLLDAKIREGTKPQQTSSVPASTKENAQKETKNEKEVDNALSGKWPTELGEYQMNPLAERITCILRPRDRSLFSGQGGWAESKRCRIIFGDPPPDLFC